MEQKKRLVVSYKNCPNEVLEAIREKYPLGYSDDVIKVNKPNGEPFYAITIETATANYLVKVDVKIDNLTDEEFDKQFGTKNDDGEQSEQKDDENSETLAAPETYDD